MRHGADWRHPDGGHTIGPVLAEMMLQVCTDYPGIPDVRSMTASEIMFFYEGLRAGLKKHTAGK